MSSARVTEKPFTTLLEGHQRHLYTDPDGIMAILCPSFYFNSLTKALILFHLFERGRVLYAAINFIQNNPPRDKPPVHVDLKGANPPGQSSCTKTLPSEQNRESKAPPRDIKLENLTNISLNSDTI